MFNFLKGTQNFLWLDEDTLLIYWPHACLPVFPTLLETWTMLSLATISSLHPCLLFSKPGYLHFCKQVLFCITCKFNTLQTSPSLQARWWEDVDFLQFTETFCQGGNHVKASKWSACTYMHQLVHHRACTSILRFCINFERVYIFTHQLVQQRVHLFYISASTLSVCTYLNHPVHQRVYLFYVSASTLSACLHVHQLLFQPILPRWRMVLEKLSWK